MFVKQSIYYFDGVDTHPVEVEKQTKKCVYIILDNKTKRVKKASCYYQETEGGFIDVDKLDRLCRVNSNKIPDKFIIQNDIGTWQGIGIVRERKATCEDYKKYPQVVQREFIRWTDWCNEDEKGVDIDEIIGE